MNCRRSWTKICATSPEICCCTTLRNLNVQLYNCSFILAKIIYTSDDNCVLQRRTSSYFCLTDLFQLNCVFRVPLTSSDVTSALGPNGRERKVGFLGMGTARLLPISWRVWGTAVSSPSGAWGGAPTAKGFYRILNTQDDLSGQQDYEPRRFYFFGFLADW